MNIEEISYQPVDPQRSVKQTKTKQTSGDIGFKIMQTSFLWDNAAIEAYS